MPATEPIQMASLGPPLTSLNHCPNNWPFRVVAAMEQQPYLQEIVAFHVLRYDAVMFECLENDVVH
jgi:hypothetical protein